MGGRGKAYHRLFWKYKKSALILQKGTFILVCIYGLNSHLKCSFKSMLDKKHQNFYTYDVFLLYVVLEYMEYLSN